MLNIHPSAPKTDSDVCFPRKGIFPFPTYTVKEISDIENDSKIKRIIAEFKLRIQGGNLV